MIYFIAGGGKGKISPPGHAVRDETKTCPTPTKIKQKHSSRHRGRQQLETKVTFKSVRTPTARSTDD